MSIAVSSATSANIDTKHLGRGRMIYDIRAAAAAGNWTRYPPATRSRAPTHAHTRTRVATAVRAAEATGLQSLELHEMRGRITQRKAVEECRMLLSGALREMDEEMLRLGVMEAYRLQVLPTADVSEACGLRSAHNAAVEAEVQLKKIAALKERAFVAVIGKERARMEAVLYRLAYRHMYKLVG